MTDLNALSVDPFKFNSGLGILVGYKIRIALDVEGMVADQMGFMDGSLSMFRDQVMTHLEP